MLVKLFLRKKSGLNRAFCHPSPAENRIAVLKQFWKIHPERVTFQLTVRIKLKHSFKLKSIEGIIKI
jgi:hypothetical protein